MPALCICISAYYHYTYLCSRYEQWTVAIDWTLSIVETFIYIEMIDNILFEKICMFTFRSNLLTKVKYDAKKRRVSWFNEHLPFITFFAVILFKILLKTHSCVLCDFSLSRQHSLFFKRILFLKLWYSFTIFTVEVYTVNVNSHCPKFYVDA